MEPHRKKKVDYYPTIDEILHDPPVKCNDCGQDFRNSSACRFHQLKMHPNAGCQEPNDQRIVLPKLSTVPTPTV
ncbi:hypothetical protein CRE_31397 [Caenorhabditis remanei]|uniref:C2H2-type domain-containing protein n=1 Tax=Caenorhabditis remanei TaxID=31234 RepID=E3N5W6_CAERE|nr:hypothetical protein CRE_31397 [Caenorhabditis remanei]